LKPDKVGGEETVRQLHSKPKKCILMRGGVCRGTFALKENKGKIKKTVHWGIHKKVNCEEIQTNSAGPLTGEGGAKKLCKDKSGGLGGVGGVFVALSEKMPFILLGMELKKQQVH